MGGYSNTTDPADLGARPVKVFLDTSVYKFSATQLPRLKPKRVVVSWHGRAKEIDVHEPVMVNPNERIKNPVLKSEADLLPKVAELGLNGQAEFMISMETQIEIMGLPDMDSTSGYFYSAPVAVASPPIHYGRIMFGGLQGWWEDQFDFLCSLDHNRFRALRVMTGAYQGVQKPNRNQLLDAFHLWCAEHNKCQFFLTLDFKLARMIEQSKLKPFVAVVSPSNLLAAISLAR